MVTSKKCLQGLALGIFVYIQFNENIDVNTFDPSEFQSRLSITNSSDDNGDEFNELIASPMTLLSLTIQSKSNYGVDRILMLIAICILIMMIIIH